MKCPGVVCNFYQKLNFPSALAQIGATSEALRSHVAGPVASPVAGPVGVIFGYDLCPVHRGTQHTPGDASKVMFFNNENKQIQIVTNYDWNNFVSVPVDNTGSFDGTMKGIAVSSDGSKACTVADWPSSDGGMTWTKVSSLGIDEWRSVTMSPDGSKLLVCAKTGRVVLSNVAGSTWSDLNGGQSQYADCSMSADGQTIALARRSVELEVSTDGGSTSTYSSSGTSNSDDRSWNKVLVSTDGSKISWVSCHMPVAVASSVLILAPPGPGRRV